MPLHALANAKSENCLDCRNVQFNLNNHNFSYFPSADTFVNIDKVANEFKAIKKDNTIVIKISNKNEKTETKIIKICY